MQTPSVKDFYNMVVDDVKKLISALVKDDESKLIEKMTRLQQNDTQGEWNTCSSSS